MIQLRFNSLAGTDPGTVGPAPFFRIEGAVLQQGRERIVVGRYSDHYWEIDDRFVSSYECMQSALLHFEGPDGDTSRVYGPFQHVRFPNGSCYADRTLFAELVDEHGVASGRAGPGSQWLHRGELIRWPALVIRPADQASIRPRSGHGGSPAG
jgi:hypothetical protein